MNEVQVIIRNDISDVPKYLPIIFELLSEGIPLKRILEKDKRLPRRSNIYRWIDAQSDLLRQEIMDKFNRYREFGSGDLEDRAQIIACEPVYDKEDAVIKMAQVKMLLDVAKVMKPRIKKDESYFDKVNNMRNNEENLVPAMTKEQAIVILRERQGRKNEA